MIDNRYKLEVDPQKVQTWEIMLLEKGQTLRVTDLVMVFSRYLANGSGPISPDLPDKPLNKLTAEERAQIEASEAYGILCTFPVPKLRDISKSFVENAIASFDPN